MKFAEKKLKFAEKNLKSSKIKIGYFYCENFLHSLKINFNEVWGIIIYRKQKYTDIQIEHQSHAFCNGKKHSFSISIELLIRNDKGNGGKGRKMEKTSGKKAKSWKQTRENSFTSIFHQIYRNRKIFFIFYNFSSFSSCAHPIDTYLLCTSLRGLLFRLLFLPFAPSWTVCFSFTHSANIKKMISALVEKFIISYQLSRVSIVSRKDSWNLRILRNFNGFWKMRESQKM